MENFDSLEDVKEHIRQGIDDCVEYVVSLAASYNSEIRVVQACSMEDLPKYLNTVSKPAQEIVKSRLNGSKVMDFDPFLEVLFDVDFDYSEYRDLGVNDGALQTFSTLASRLGMDEESKRAASAVYSYD